MTDPDSLRLRPFNAVLITAGAWAIVAGGIPAVLLLVTGASDDRAVYWGLIAATAGAVFAWASYRVRLEMDSEEVRVFNVRKTYRIPWGAMTRIDVVGWWLSPSVIIVGNAAVRVTTQAGEKIVIDASTSEVSRVLGTLARVGRGRVEIRPG